MVVRNVGLAVLAEDAAVRVNDGDRVEGGVADALVVADRQDNTEVVRDFSQLADRRVFFERRREMVVFIAFFLAEVPVFEQLGQKNDLCALRGRLAHLCERVFQTVGHLHRRYGYFFRHNVLLFNHIKSLTGIRFVFPAAG